jgi:hypothetical protein
VTAVVRLRRDLFDRMVADLGREHPVAYERVGFVFGKLARADSLGIVLPFEYVPVPDEQYIEDDAVGAMINENAIFYAHQRARSTGLCCLHVHMHAGTGRTWFSHTDLETLHRLGPSLLRMAGQSAHGGLVLTHTNAAALLWLSDQPEPLRGHVSIVGFPTTLHRGVHQ